MADTAKKSTLKQLIMATVMLALCLLLPFLTAQLQTIGSMLAPMHIPVLLCGFLCGWKYGLGVGFIAPLLRSVLFGMPPLVPVALAMSFELAAYGALAGLLYAAFAKNVPNVYWVLILSMLGGRLVWGVAAFFIYTAMGTPFTLAIFFAGAFAKAVPGIIVHILLIPPIVLAMRRAGQIE